MKWEKSILLLWGERIDVIKFKSLIKILLAGCLAFMIMTAFCLFYYNSAIHYPNTSGATDHIWTPDFRYSQCREGISCGKTNNEGFMNSFDYKNGMKIDVLVMGSSHMEGGNVAQNETTASRLNVLLQDKTVYNIGISGHTFLTCCSNFEAAVNCYHPTGYVVIETSKLNFSTEELNSVLDGTIPELTDHSEGILGFLSRNQFLRLVYHQLQGFLGRTPDDAQDVMTSGPIDSQDQGEDTGEALSNVLSLLARMAAEHDVKLIILYHPSTQINADGSILFPDDEKDRMKYSNLCDEYGITFLDMTERFRLEYETKHILPHGFFNSSIGSGHLNKYGHEMIADELYRIIEESR